jgi:hypothetical protein
MTTKCKKTVDDLSGLKGNVFNDEYFLSENLMQKLVQREIARIVRTSENLCIASVCFEKLLNNSMVQTNSDNNVKLFFTSVETLKRNVRETDLLGWIKKDCTFGIVFTVDKKVSMEIIEKRIHKVLDFPSNNDNSASIDIDVTMLSADDNDTNKENIGTVVQNYFKKKHQYMSQK